MAGIVNKHGRFNDLSVRINGGFDDFLTLKKNHAAADKSSCSLMTKRVELGD